MRTRSLAEGGLALALTLAVWAPAMALEPRIVAREEILEAMHQSRGYALTATANGPRLQAEVLLHLVRRAEATDPDRRPLHVGHAEWYEAFLQRTDLTPAEAPVYVRLPYLVGQDLVADYRWERVIETVVEGPRPRTAVNLRIFWPDVVEQDSFSYEDLRSDPTLRVTLERDIHYRLLDYGNQLWYAEVSGVHGRPTSGALGLLFDILGEARVLETRAALSSDGLQVVRASGRKLFVTRTSTVTIWPEGKAKQGIPADRPDLGEIEDRLKQPVEIRFAPWEQGDD